MRFAKLTDDELTALARLEDKAAFTELISRHDGAAFQLALSMLRDCYDAASDAVQMARIECWQSIGMAEPRDFGAWFLGIVRHCCLQLHKRRQRSADWMALDAIDEIVASPLDQLIDIEERSYLHGAVDALPPQQSQALRMRYLEGRDYSEIARLMELTEATIRVHVASALQNLRERLGANSFLIE